MHKSSRKAFTLIELLVVIAIIAILAAILFPVFAQAKSAAKKAAATSNLKQNALAVLMYNDSNDDTFPQSAYPQLNGTVKELVSAFDAIYPFTKNKDIYQDPGEPGAIDWKNVLATKTTALGGPYVSQQKIEQAGVAFNFALFEDPAIPPTLGTNDPVVAASAVGNPVGTPMFYSATYTAKSTDSKYKKDYLTSFKGVAAYATPTGDFNRFNFAGAPRHSGQLVINFVDGHVTSKRGNAVLEGTGVDLGTTSTTAINCFNLPFDLNGIPDTVGEPRD